MSPERVERWLALVANFAVLLGILFLALELRQANSIAIATNEISIRGEFRSANELILNNEDVAQLLVKAKNSDADFSPVETERLYAYFYASLNTWMSIEIAYANGMVTTETFEMLLEDIRGVLTYYAALQPLMRESLNDYPSLVDTQVYATLREVLADTE